MELLLIFQKINYFVKTSLVHHNSTYPIALYMYIQ